MTKAREISYSHFDPINPKDVFQLSHVPIPDVIGNREVLVRMRQAMVHPCDIGCASGLVNGVRLPAVGGFEGVGVVEEIGSSVGGQFFKGQRVHVCATHIFGCWENWLGVWRDYAVLPAESLIPIPDEINDDVAAQIFVNVLTPLAMAKEMKLGPGDVILQTAAASVVGQVMIQLGKLMGFETINLVRREEAALELMNVFNIDTVYVHDGTLRSEETVRKNIEERVGTSPIRFSIDAVSGDIGRFCLRMLSPGGAVYYYGALSGDPLVSVDIVTDLCRNNKSVHGWSIQETWLRSTSDAIKRDCINEIWEFLSEQSIVLPVIGEKFPLEEVKEAVIASQRPKKDGKVMLVF